MLIEFRVKNILSFKEEQVFSMVASSLSELPENKIEVENSFHTLKSASIFGANASGKSNLLDALVQMQSFIHDSVKKSQDKRGLPFLPFALNPKTREENSVLEVTFIYKSTLYRLGFEIGKKQIVQEWLYIDEEEIYTRTEGNLAFYNSNYFKDDEVKLKFSMTNEKSLFITILSNTNTDFAEEILDYFKTNLNVINGISGGRFGYTKELLKDGSKDVKNKLLKMLTFTDLNIKDLTIKKHDFEISGIEDPEIEIPKEILEHLELESNRLLSEHNVYNDEGEIVGSHSFDAEYFESSGTKEFIRLAGPIIDTLQNGKVLFIDEVDAQLHPLMTQYIMGLFNSKENKNAQLVITSHNSTILSSKLQRRDQVWFVEKDRLEGSHLTSLSNYKFKGEVVRADENYEKNYLKGKYGAIPHIKSNLIDDLTRELSEVSNDKI